MASGYDSDDSDRYYEDLDDLEPTEPIKFTLYEHLNAEPVIKQGALKAYGVKSDGSAIYAERRSDYSVSVDRLLWVDGYEETSRDGNRRKSDQKMTLVVLKIVLTSLDPDTKFEHVSATLQLEDKEGHGPNEPRVQAWAPFRTLERWNAAVGHREIADQTELGIKVGYAGSDLTARRGRESKISWDQTDFDEGHSNEEISKGTGRRNGVTWFVKQNNLQSQGITPEMWVSALFSRSSNAPYVVKFSIFIRAGTNQNIRDKTKRFFGMRPGQTNAYTVTPGKKTICNFEGEHILRSIDLNNLGKLREGTKLNVTWGPRYQVASPEVLQPAMPRQESHTPVKIATLAEEATTQIVASDGERAPKATDTAMQVPDGVAAGVGLPPTNHPAAAPNGPQYSLQPGQNGLPPLMIGWYNPNSIIDPSRFAALEYRLAQAEARIATQDLTILQLREAQMTKDARLAVVERAAAGRSTP